MRADMTGHTPSSRIHPWRRWLFIVAVAVQLLVACASIVLISSVRVVVTGEDRKSVV